MINSCFSHLFVKGALFSFSLFAGSFLLLLEGNMVLLQNGPEEEKSKFLINNRRNKNTLITLITYNFIYTLI